MKKVFYPVLDYFFEHKTARAVAYYTLLVSLMLCVWGLDAWRIASIMALGALLHIHGLIDGSRIAFDSGMGERK